MMFTRLALKCLGGKHNQCYARHTWKARRNDGNLKLAYHALVLFKNTPLLACFGSAANLGENSLKNRKFGEIKLSGNVGEISGKFRTFAKVSIYLTLCVI